jgi:hypothetical protein
MIQFSVFWNRKEVRKSVISIGTSQRTSALLMISVDDNTSAYVTFLGNEGYTTNKETSKAIIIRARLGFINTFFPSSFASIIVHVSLC